MGRVGVAGIAPSRLLSTHEVDPPTFAASPRFCSHARSDRGSVVPAGWLKIPDSHELAASASTCGTHRAAQCRPSRPGRPQHAKEEAARHGALWTALSMSYQRSAGRRPPLHLLRVSESVPVGARVPEPRARAPLDDEPCPGATAEDAPPAKQTVKNRTPEAIATPQSPTRNAFNKVS